MKKGIKMIEQLPFYNKKMVSYIFTNMVYEWKDTDDFDATLLFKDSISMRSGTGALMEDENTGYQYIMLPSSFFNIITDMNYGKIHGIWKFVKRGSSYGIERKT